MMVASGAAEKLRSRERAQFLAEEWPPLRRRIARLGLSARELLDGADMEARQG
jgi:GntR family transcriptional regulator